VLEAGTRAQATQRPVALAEVRLLPPVQPPTARDFVAFEEHMTGMVMRNGGPDAAVPEQWYEAPTFYFTNPYAMIGAHDDVPVPPGSRMLDFELEVAAVVGKAGQNLSPEAAREHIVGYTIFNDWSARDLTTREMKVGLGPVKGKDTATTLGPWLVTADELEPRRQDGMLDLELTALLNSTVFGRDRLANMAWTFEEMAAYASRGTWIRPGDVLASGTCAGGCLAEAWGRAQRIDPPPLAAGDVVELVVEGIGSVRNTVAGQVTPVFVPSAHRRVPSS
jgi:2-keto-4-pentenoate hydratase/2-oxohepta-3-ene-1,7-dioic acid hydratase in catechol pathway